MIRMFVSDLDGTLLNEAHQSDEVIKGALRKLTDAGCIFAAATGRTPDAVDGLGFGDLPIYDICMNGSLILDEKRNIIRQFPLPKDFVKQFASAFGAELFLYNDCGKTYTTASLEEVTEFARKYWQLDEMPKEDVSRLFSAYRFDLTPEEIAEKNIFKIDGIPEKKEICERVDELAARYKGKVVNDSHDGRQIELTNACANKGEASRWLADYLKIPEEEAAVYGDGGNDLKLLAAFPHSYAPENADAPAKKAASETIGNCRDHAVPLHMLKLAGI